MDQVQIFKRLSSANFTWSIFEYPDLYERARASCSILKPSKEDILSWKNEGVEYLRNSPDTAKMAFEACCISTIGLEKAHTDDNLRSVYYYCLLFIYYNNCYDGKTVPISCFGF